MPLEAACVFIGREKQTIDVGKGLGSHTGKVKSQSFYIKNNTLDTETFDMVAWEDIQDITERTSKMYR